jgi:pentatricopeptide repeat protein
LHVNTIAALYRHIVFSSIRAEYRCASSSTHTQPAHTQPYHSSTLTPQASRLCFLPASLAYTGTCRARVCEPGASSPITVCQRGGEWRKALSLFLRMNSHGPRPDVVVRRGKTKRNTIWSCGFGGNAGSTLSRCRSRVEGRFNTKFNKKVLKLCDVLLCCVGVSL